MPEAIEFYTRCGGCRRSLIYFVYSILRVNEEKLIKVKKVIK